MALPRILQKLFQNGGAGPRLLKAIMPEGVVFSVNGNSPDANGNVAAGDAMEADILSAADKAVDGTVTNVGSVDVANLVSAVASVEAGLDGKLPLSTAHVVETWSSGKSWYRKWSDGFIEQGGETYGVTSSTSTLTFNTAFSNTNYAIVFTDILDYGYDWQVMVKTRGTVSCVLYRSSANKYSTIWYACGY